MVQTILKYREAVRTLRILVVEDNPAFQLQLTSALARLDKQYETSIFSLGAEALAFVNDFEALGGKVDLALIDIGLPDMSGIDVIKAIHARMPDTPIIIISVINSDTVLLDAIRAGARGYILKGEDTTSIGHAIAEVFAGNFPISPSLAQNLFRMLGGPSRDEAAEGGELTPREVEVLQMIARGLSYRETAKALKMSLSTVQTHIRALYRKLDAHNRQSAVNRGRDVGII